MRTSWRHRALLATRAIALAVTAAGCARSTSVPGTEASAGGGRTPRSVMGPMCGVTTAADASSCAEAADASPAHAAPASASPAHTPSASSARITAWRQLFNGLSGIASRACGGYRTAQAGNGTSIVLPADCFFAPGATDVRADASAAVAHLAGAMRGIIDQRFLVGVHARGLAPDAGAAPSSASLRLTSARAASLVDALSARGIDPSRLIAAGFGGHGAIEEVYDGPAPLAPGEEVVEIVLLPRAGELPQPDFNQRP